MVGLINAYKAWGLLGPIIYGSLQNDHAISSVECWGHWCVWCGVSGGFGFSPSRELSSWSHIDEAKALSSTEHCLHVSHLPLPNYTPAHTLSPLRSCSQGWLWTPWSSLRCWGYRCEPPLPTVSVEDCFCHSPCRHVRVKWKLEELWNLEMKADPCSCLPCTLSLHPQKL